MQKECIALYEIAEVFGNLVLTSSFTAKICSLHFTPERYDPERPGHLLSSAVPNYLSQPCDCISSCPMACTGQASTSRTLKEIKFKSVNSDAPSTGITQFKAKGNLLSNQSLHKESVVKVTDPKIPSTSTAFLKMIPSSSNDPAMIHSQLSHEESMLPVTDLAEAVINTAPMKIIPSSSPDLVSVIILILI
ncbi:hypothetical protein evm_004094 [Chilo suppressalis]|nr:hypothetical protein evm_004094 [Chilo suppressalis]